MGGVAIRLLIVDDHPSFRATARALLEVDGFEVVAEAADGESALAAARATRPEVILLDIQLPDMDGFEVVERLMANGTPPAIVAIWTLALASLAGAGALVLTSNYLDRKVVLTVLALGVPLTYFASGLVGWTRRPGSRIGLLLVCIGFAWLVAALPAANWSVPFTVGLALQALFLAVITHLVLAFPSGRLEAVLDQTIVIAVYALVLVGRPIKLLFEEVAPKCDGDPCPTNLLV